MDEFDLLFQRNFEEGLPVVVYRPPGSSHICLVRQKNNEAAYVRDYRESGFVFAPFDPDGRPLLIRADAITRLEVGAKQPPLEADTERLQSGPGEKDGYIRLVHAARAHIARGLCRKIVVSRQTTLPFAGSPLGVFRAMLPHYPSACCYLLYHPISGIWLGATPELLLEVEAASYRTVSLAGTRKKEAHSTGWGAKEVMEQQLVTDYIGKALKPLVETVKIAPSRTVRAGSLFHLESRIDGETGGAGIAQLVHALHPTPAVCGLPRDAALSFIREHEGYDRAYYSGFLGELNLPRDGEFSGQENCRFFVNLRCMRIANDQANLYVGGGITAASNPESEWEETVGKESTMRRVMLNSAG